MTDWLSSDSQKGAQCQRAATVSALLLLSTRLLYCCVKCLKAFTVVLISWAYLFSQMVIIHLLVWISYYIATTLLSRSRMDSRKWKSVLHLLRCTIHQSQVFNDVALGREMLVGPSLWSRLEYLNYWMDCNVVQILMVLMDVFLMTLIFSLTKKKFIQVHY